MSDVYISFTADSIRKMQSRETPKTATRRVVKGIRGGYIDVRSSRARTIKTQWFFDVGDGFSDALFSPYEVGDTLHVKEPLEKCDGIIRTENEIHGQVIHYAADGVFVMDNNEIPREWIWKHSALPAIFCPHWAIRYRTLITAVYPQQLGSMTEADAVKEGCKTIAEYKDVWQAINGKKHPWDDNLWTWVIEFEQVKP